MENKNTMYHEKSYNIGGREQEFDEDPVLVVFFES